LRDERFCSAQLDQSNLEEIFNEWTSNENEVKVANALALLHQANMLNEQQKNKFQLFF
jgi:hypothetical protein